jgi:hypothetical protein
MKKINNKCFIYETLNLVFPDLYLLLNNIRTENDLFNIIAISKDEKDLELDVMSFDLENCTFRVNIFLQQNELKHPSFVFDLDLKNKKTKVLSFESQKNPHIRLDSYTEVNGVVYTNKLAEKDLKTLCKDWLRQIKNHLYEQIIDSNIKIA